MAKQYNNPNPSGKKVSSLDFGPTQDTVSNVDPNSLAGPPSGAEFMSAGMGQPGQLNFGADARSAFYRPVPKAMDNLLTPASQLVRTTVGALEQADQNALDKYGIEIDELKKQALDTSVPTSLHRINEEGVAEPNWDEVATQIEALNTKYESMFTTKGNLNIRTIGLRNRTENALKQGQNLETLWDKEFVRLTGAGYSATEIADEFDKWFAEIDDPYVHQALEKWKENTVVRYQAAIITSQNNAFTSAVDELTPFIMEEIQDPETFRTLFPNGILDPNVAREMITDLYRAGIEGDDSVSIAPNANGESGFDILMENPKDPRTIALNKQIGKIINTITDVAEDQQKEYNKHSSGMLLQRVDMVGAEDGDLDTLGALSTTAEPQEKRDNMLRYTQNTLNHLARTQGNTVAVRSNILMLGAYVDFYESQNPDTGPRQYEFGSSESINRFWNMVMVDKMSLFDIDPKSVAGAGAYDSGGLAEELLQTSPDSFAKTLNDLYGNGQYEKLREMYYETLPIGTSYEERQDSLLTSISLAHGTAFELSQQNISKKGGGGGGTGDDKDPNGEGLTEWTDVVDSLFDSTVTGQRPFLNNMSYSDRIDTQNLPMGVYRGFLAVTRLSDYDYTDDNVMQELSSELGSISEMNDEEVMNQVKILLDENTDPLTGNLTEKGRTIQLAFYQSMVYHNRAAHAQIPTQMLDNLVRAPFDLWRDGSPNEEGVDWERVTKDAQSAYLFLRDMPLSQRRQFLQGDEATKKTFNILNGLEKIKDKNGNPLFDVSNISIWSDPEKFRGMMVQIQDITDPRAFIKNVFGSLAEQEILDSGDTGVGDDPSNRNVGRLFDDVSGELIEGPIKIAGVVVDADKFQVLSQSLQQKIRDRFQIDEDDPLYKSILRTIAYNVDTDGGLRDHFSVFLSATARDMASLDETVTAAWAENFINYVFDDVYLDEDKGNPVFKVGYSNIGNPNGSPSSTPDWNKDVEGEVTDTPVAEVSRTGFGTNPLLLSVTSATGKSQDFSGVTQLTPETKAYERFLRSPYSEFPLEDSTHLANEFNRGMLRQGITDPSTMEVINQHIDSQMEMIRSNGYEVMIGDVMWARLQTYLKWNRFESQSEQGFTDVLREEMSSGNYEYADGYSIDTGNKQSIISYWRTNERFNDDITLQKGPRWYGLRLSRNANTNIPAQERGFVGVNVDFKMGDLEGGSSTMGTGNIPEGIYSIPAYLWTDNYKGSFNSSPLSPGEMLSDTSVLANRHLISDFVLTGDPEAVDQYLRVMLGVRQVRENFRQKIRENPKAIHHLNYIYAQSKLDFNPNPNNRSYYEGDARRPYNSDEQQSKREWTRNREIIKATEEALAAHAKNKVAREHHTVPQIQEAHERESNNRRLRGMGYNLVSLGIKESGDYSKEAVIAGLREDGPLNIQLQHALRMSSGSLAPLDVDSMTQEERKEYRQFKTWWSVTDKTIPLGVMREAMEIDEPTQELKYHYFSHVYDTLTDNEKEKVLNERVGISDRKSFVSAMLYADLFDKNSTLGSNVSRAITRKSAYAPRLAIVNGDLLTYPNGVSVASPSSEARRRREEFKERRRSVTGLELQKEIRNAPKEVQNVLLQYSFVSGHGGNARRFWEYALNNNGYHGTVASWNRTDPRYNQFVGEWADFRREARGGHKAKDWDWNEALDRFFQWKRIKDQQSK